MLFFLEGWEGDVIDVSMRCVSCSVVSDSLLPRRLYATGLLCPWDFPGKDTGMGCHFLLQGKLLDLGIEPRSPALQADALPSEPPGKPLLPNIEDDETV